MLRSNYLLEIKLKDFHCTHVFIAIYKLHGNLKIRLSYEPFYMPKVHSDEKCKYFIATSNKGISKADPQTSTICLDRSVRIIFAFQWGPLCRCQNWQISGRGSRTMRLRLMVTGGGRHNVYPGSNLSMEVIPYFLLDWSWRYEYYKSWCTTRSERLNPRS